MFTVSIILNRRIHPVDRTQNYLLLKRVVHIVTRSRGSSVSIVSCYGLDDRAIEVRSPAGEKICPLTSLSRPALGPTQPPAQWVPGVLSPGVKRGRDMTLTTHPHLMPRS
jgi:hypothetical protein